MRKFIIAMVCVALALALGLTAVLVVGLGGGLGGGWFTDGWMGGLELANRQTFSAAALKDLQVEYASDRITLLPAQGDEIVLEEYMRSWDDDMLAAVSESEGALGIRAGRRPNSFLGMWRCEIKLYVPAAWPGRVGLYTSSGGIRAQGNFSLDSFEAETSSGGIRVDSLEAKEDVSLVSSSGGVRAEQLRAGGGVRAETASGGIRVDTLDAAGEVSLASSSGGVTAGQLLAGGQARLKSGSGSLKVRQARAKVILAETSSGGIRFEEAAAEVVRASSGSGSVRFDALEGEFALKTTSGSIRLERAAGHGAAEASSGDVTLALAEVTGDVRVQTTSGSCRLALPQEASFYFQAKTSGGSIHTPEGLAWSDEESGGGREVFGAHGDAQGVGAGYQVEMHTSSGGVRLEWI